MTMTPGFILKQGRLVLTSGAFIVLIILLYLTRGPVVRDDLAVFPLASTSSKEDMHVSYTSAVLYNQVKDLKAVEEFTEHVLSSASSGESFTGNPIRKFNPHDILFRNKQYPPTSNEYISNASCTRWAVQTTIFSPPSEAVRRFLYMKNWCVVIIGDKNKPVTYSLKSSLKNRHIVFLSDSDQDNMKSKFVENLPWRNFGRKNVGYLYAIAHGAEFIWDFDDDNMFKFWIDGASPSDSLWIEHYLDHKQMHMKGMPVSIVTSGINLESNDSAQFFNPYPMLGAPYNNCWPRGYPLTLIRKSSNQGLFNLTKVTENIENSLNTIGVLQSLADHEPDVDALYRLIQGTPFKFKRPEKGSGSQPIIVLSKGVYTPFNAQATLHFRKAFLALYLPVTVAGRVSDIWRSYIAQTLLSLHDISVGFMPRPIVDQDRNQHSLLADLEAEFPLYTQTSALVKVMEEWRRNKTISGEGVSRSLEDLLEELYIETYERGFIEIEDVFHIQNWIAALGAVGYKTKAHANGEIKPDTPSKDNITVTQALNIDVGKSIIKSEITEPVQCKHLKKEGIQATFWTSDLHDGTRLDSPSLLTSLGQTFVIAGFKRWKTPYPSVFKRPGFVIPQNISNQILHYGINTQATPNLIENNFKFYENDSLFENTDAFYCSFYASMCQLWMPLNKTKSIIMIAAHRYNLGRCSVERWSKLNDQLLELVVQSNGSQRVDHKHVIAGASRYDYEYLKHYTGLKHSVQLISSFSGFYTGGNEYKSTEPEILVVSLRDTFMPTLKNMTKIRVVSLYEKYKHYELSDLVKHKAIIYIPYAVMSFKPTEFYSLNIPLFMPSAKYFRNNGGLGSDRTSTSLPYCANDPDLWWKMPGHPSSPHSYNPNAEFAQDAEAEMYWLQFSDFYDWPHIQYFDDVHDLHRILFTADFHAIHEAMKAENEIRKNELLEKWCTIIPQIKKKLIIELNVICHHYFTHVFI